jgi:hypothetical protein
MTEDFYSNFDRILKMGPSEPEGILEEWEVEAIIISFFRERGEKGGTEEEVVNIIKWCEGQRIGASLVDLVCKGFVYIGWSEEENSPVFGITEEGKTMYEGESNGAN